MIIHPFISRRKGKYLVAKPDPMGFVTVSCFKTLKGAKSHANRTNGVVQGGALQRAPLSNRNKVIARS